MNLAVIILSMRQVPKTLASKRLAGQQKERGSRVLDGRRRTRPLRYSGVSCCNSTPLDDHRARPNRVRARPTRFHNVPMITGEPAVPRFSVTAASVIRSYLDSAEERVNRCCALGGHFLLPNRQRWIPRFERVWPLGATADGLGTWTTAVARAGSTNCARFGARLPVCHCGFSQGRRRSQASALWPRLRKASVAAWMQRRRLCGSAHLCSIYAPLAATATEIDDQFTFGKFFVGKRFFGKISIKVARPSRHGHNNARAILRVRNATKVEDGGLTKRHFRVIVLNDHAVVLVTEDTT